MSVVVDGVGDVGGARLDQQRSKILQLAHRPSHWIGSESWIEDSAPDVLASEARVVVVARLKTWTADYGEQICAPDATLADG